MAEEVLSDISGALAQTFAPELTRNWNRRAVFAQNVPIKMGGGQGAGQNVAWDVEFSGATAASFDEGDDVSDGEFATDPVDKAVLPWGQYRSAFKLSNLEINVAAANMGNATALEDIAGERFLGSISKILDLIETDCFTGDGTDGSGNPNIIGLNTALSASGDYAGLAVGTYTEWAGNVSANSGTPRALTMGLLAASEQLAFTASGFEPDMLMTTAGVHTKYESLFEAARRTVDNGQGPIPSYQGSTGRLYWRGKPVVRNRVAPAGYIYMLNADELEFRVLPWAGVNDGIRVESRSAVSSNGKTMDAVGIPFHVYPLARTGSAVKFCVEVYCQLKVKRRNAHVMIKDISES